MKQERLFPRTISNAIRELVRARLVGLELRQRARDEKRRMKNSSRKPSETEASQPDLWSEHAN